MIWLRVKSWVNTVKRMPINKEREEKQNVNANENIYVVKGESSVFIGMCKLFVPSKDLSKELVQ